jgi:ZIP family zinc transporter
VQGAIQHFAAGVVFAAVAGEVLPEIRAEGELLPLILGFSLGVAAMLTMKWFTERMGGHGSAHKGDPEGEQPTALLVTVGIDLLMDGLLVGIGFAAGATTGMLLTVALTLEVLFLGLSTAVTLRKAGAPSGRTLATVGALALGGHRIGIPPHHCAYGEHTRLGGTRQHTLLARHQPTQGAAIEDQQTLVP